MPSLYHLIIDHTGILVPPIMLLLPHTPFFRVTDGWTFDFWTATPTLITSSLIIIVNLQVSGKPVNQCFWSTCPYLRKTCWWRVAGSRLAKRDIKSIVTDIKILESLDLVDVERGKRPRRVYAGSSLRCHWIIGCSVMNTHRQYIFSTIFPVSIHR